MNQWETRQTPPSTLLVQLPIPQLNFARQTGNIPYGGACLKLAADAAGVETVDLLPESVATYLGDAALVEWIFSRKPAVVGFTVYAWNIDRTLYLAERLKTLYEPRIVIGGPEVTPDNPRIQSPFVDVQVYGDGESTFTALLKEKVPWNKSLYQGEDNAFIHGKNPYVAGILESWIEKMALIETQRGCIHRCGYCYYGKSRKGPVMAYRDRVIEAVACAIEMKIPEIYLLDPCLDVRRDLHELLRAIAKINGDQKTRLISEIRAESVDGTMANLFAAAGFSWFEIGLQTITPAALSIMNRKTDINAFLRGTNRLKDRGIGVGIDLIAGLPGDHPHGFSRSVDFVVENDLAEDVQVFPLSVLPGTQFRKVHGELGLRFDPAPPYPIIETPTFSPGQLREALEFAQDRFDLSLYPFPDLDLSGCVEGICQEKNNLTCQVRVSGIETIVKLFFNRPEHLESLKTWARRLSHPYQLFFGPFFTDIQKIGRVIRACTAANPFTPVEIVFVAHNESPDTDYLLSASHLVRPHYLDKDMDFLYHQSGNRAILFTLLTKKTDLVFQGEMTRQVTWWTGENLPDVAAMERLEGSDGIFIPCKFTSESIARWQKKMAPKCQDLPAITFADPLAQKDWIRRTTAEDYWLDLLPVQ